MMKSDKTQQSCKLYERQPPTAAGATFSFYSFPMEQPRIQQLSAPKGEFVEPPQSSKPITTSSYELCPGFIAMVRELAFSGLDYENPYTHLWEFEQLCACLTIAGMSQETLWWKLFPSQLMRRRNNSTPTT